MIVKRNELCFSSKRCDLSRSPKTELGEKRRLKTVKFLSFRTSYNYTLKLVQYAPKSRFIYSLKCSPWPPPATPPQRGEQYNYFSIVNLLPPCRSLRNRQPNIFRILFILNLNVYESIWKKTSRNYKEVNL